VDQAGLFDSSAQNVLSNGDERDQVRAFQDEETALAALHREEIQAFFIFPQQYRSTIETELITLHEPPSADSLQQLKDMVRSQLVSDQPESLQARLLEGPNITTIDISNGREFRDEDFNIILPFIASGFFFVATLSASGYMVQIVADEKENRTMELLLTSLTPGQLIGGKTAGLLAVIMTQLGIYALALLLILAVAFRLVGAPQNVAIPWTYLAIMALFFFPSFLLIAAAMTAVGSAVANLQQGQQLAGILNLLFMLPIFLLAFILENPASPAIIFFSFFPTTAFLTISLRWGLGSLPLWQIALSWIMLVIVTLFMMRAAARIFRTGMLRYGQPLTLKSAFRAVRRS
jgi:ABC-2 type transport system permease protein